VHRELIRWSDVPNGKPEQDKPGSTLGLDGKSYPRERRPGPRQCLTCGEMHSKSSGECPWDLFAQGIGPHPDNSASRPSDSRDPQTPTAKPDPTVPRIRDQAVEPDAKTNGAKAGPRTVQTHDQTGEVAVNDQLSRLEGVLREINGFNGFVTALEYVVNSELEFAGDITLITGRIQELIGSIRGEIAGWPNLLDRLQRVADVVQLGSSPCANALSPH